MRTVLRQGLHTLTRHKKSFLLLYVLNLSLALSIAIPFALELDRAIGDSRFRETLVETADLGWLGWFQDQAGPTARTLTPSILGAGPFVRNLHLLLTGEFLRLPSQLLLLWGIYWILQQFLLAAILGSLATAPRGATLREFFRSGGEFFGRFLRLGMLAGALAGGLIVLCAVPARLFIFDFVARAPTDRLAWLVAASGMAMAAWMLWLLRIISDYARIQITTCDRSSVVLAYGAALSFFFSNLAGAITLSLLLTLVPLALVGIYAGVMGMLPQTATATILMGFLVQQLFVLGRLAARVYGLATQTHFLLSRESLFRPVAGSRQESGDTQDGSELPILQP